MSPENTSQSKTVNSNKSEPESLSQTLAQIVNNENSVLSMREFAENLEQHGIAMVMIVFALPAAAPIPAVGYSTLCAVPLLLIAFQLLRGSTSIWMPERLGKKEFKPAALKPALDKLSPMLEFMEKFTKPRFPVLSEASFTPRLIGLFVLALAASMALPIPGTNTAPAFAVFILGFGLLQKDGLIIAVGMLASIVAMSISLLIIFFGIEAIEYLKNLL